MGRYLSLLDDRLCLHPKEPQVGSRPSFDSFGSTVKSKSSRRHQMQLVTQIWVNLLDVLVRLFAFLQQHTHQGHWWWVSLVCFRHCCPYYSVEIDRRDDGTLQWCPVHESAIVSCYLSVLDHPLSSTWIVLRKECSVRRLANSKARERRWIDFHYYQRITFLDLIFSLFQYHQTDVVLKTVLVPPLSLPWPPPVSSRSGKTWLQIAMHNRMLHQVYPMLHGEFNLLCSWQPSLLSVGSTSITVRTPP